MKSDLVYGSLLFVVLEGFEPSQAEPESDVLPLHHRTIPNCDCKGTAFSNTDKKNSNFFSKKITAAPYEICPTLSRKGAK